MDNLSGFPLLRNTAILICAIWAIFELIFGPPRTPVELVSCDEELSATLPIEDGGLDGKRDRREEARKDKLSFLRFVKENVSSLYGPQAYFDSSRFIRGLVIPGCF
jgi:hypothetical protein